MIIAFLSAEMCLYAAVLFSNVFVCRSTVFITLVSERMQNKASTILCRVVSPAEIKKK
jgi:hypothetical protein